jgi:quercetin dioxygenase-like cupin family protein
MRRRTFLQSAAALPVAGWQSLAFADTAVPSAGELHRVGDGQDRLDENHSLGYSTILFKVLPRETADGLLLIEHRNLQKTGPPVHIHPHQEEWFYVIDGQLLLQVADKRTTLGPGESITAPRGIPHGFLPIGDKPVRMLIAFTPAGKMESFFREAAVPNGPKMDADLFARHEMQYVGPPLTAG